MPIYKIQAGRIITTTVDEYIGDPGTIFYDEAVPQLRLSDGSTAGGIVFPGQGGTGTYTLLTATNIRLGGVKIGTGLIADADGTISALATSTYTLVTATNVRLGGVKIGSGLTVTADGTISAVATSTYILTTATTTTLGGIKVGENLTISADGTLNANTATAGISDSFKTIKSTGQPDLVASGADTIEIVAGSGILIETSATSVPFKTMTISASSNPFLDGGFPDSVYEFDHYLDGGNP